LESLHESSQPFDGLRNFGGNGEVGEGIKPSEASPSQFPVFGDALEVGMGLAFLVKELNPF